MWTMKGPNLDMRYLPCRISPGRSEYMMAWLITYLHVRIRTYGSSTRDVRTSGCGSTDIYHYVVFLTILWCVWIHQFIWSRSRTNICMTQLACCVLFQRRPTSMCMYNFIVCHGHENMSISWLKDNTLKRTCPQKASAAFTSCICALNGRDWENN